MASKGRSTILVHDAMTLVTHKLSATKQRPVLTVSGEDNTVDELYDTTSHLQFLQHLLGHRHLFHQDQKKVKSILYI